MLCAQIPSSGPQIQEGAWGLLANQPNLLGDFNAKERDKIKKSIAIELDICLSNVFDHMCVKRWENA